MNRSSIAALTVRTALGMVLVLAQARADDLCADDDDIEEQIKACTAVIQSDHRSKDAIASAYLHRAQASLKKKAYDQAWADADESIRREPQSVEALLARGAASQGGKKYDRAVADYDAAIAIDPNSAAAYVMRGSALGFLGKLDQSIEDSTRAIELIEHALSVKDPMQRPGALASEMGRAFYNRGLAWKLKRQYKKAIADYDAAARANPADPHSWAKRQDDWGQRKPSAQAELLYQDMGFSADLNTSDPRIYEISEIQPTRFGNALLVKTSILPAATVFLNGQVIFESEGMYVGLYGYFRSNDVDVLLVGSNPGGSGTPQTEMAFLVIRSASDVRVLTDQQFVAEYDGAIKTRMDREGRIFVSLGYSRGYEMVARYDSGQLTVDALSHAGEPLAETHCKWLYDEGQKTCTSAFAREQGCSAYAEHTSLGESLSDMGEFTYISNRPGFVQAGLNAACRTWCEGKTVRYAKFRKTTCTIK